MNPTQLLAQLREKINPDRHGGVSVHDLEEAIRMVDKLARALIKYECPQCGELGAATMCNRCMSDAVHPGR